MSAHNLYAGLTGSKVVVTVPRADIEQRYTTPALASLNPLIASRDALAASNGTISLLVSGAMMTIRLARSATGSPTTS